MQSFKKRIYQFIIILIVILVSLFTISVYLKNTLNGNIDHHILPGEMFGVPKELASKGLTPLYYGQGQTGWDGQFYYYMANDIFALKDTPQHVDANAYRYQRIGLSLWAAILSLITLQSWVSPTMYYFSNLLIMLIATWCGIKLLNLYKINPAWILCWSFGIGTQVTILNGLPDAAADSFLIIGLFALSSQKRWIGFTALTFAALSREAYILFPIFIGISHFISFAKSQSEKSFVKVFASWLFSLQALPYAIVGFIFLAWHVYIRLHFNVSPSSQAHGILALPFVEWWKAVKSGLLGSHYLVPAGLPSIREGVALLCFIFLLAVVFVLAVKLVLRDSKASYVIRGFALALIPLCILYACFGKTVISHYTGYLKAANFFLFAVPFLASIQNSRKLYLVSVSVVLFTLAFSNYYLWVDRILSNANPGYSKYTNPINAVIGKKPLTKLNSFDVGIKILRIEKHTSSGIVQKMLGKDFEVFHVRLENKSSNALQSCLGEGSVHMSYHILSEDGNTVVKDGIRTILPHKIAPGMIVDLPVVVEYPVKPGRYILRLSPVQEAHVWFYNANPESKLDLPFEIVN